VGCMVVLRVPRLPFVLCPRAPPGVSRLLRPTRDLKYPPAGLVGYSEYAAQAAAWRVQRVHARVHQAVRRASSRHSAAGTRSVPRLGSARPAACKRALSHKYIPTLAHARAYTAELRRSCVGAASEPRGSRVGATVVTCLARCAARSRAVHRAIVTRTGRRRLAAPALPCCMYSRAGYFLPPAHSHSPASCAAAPFTCSDSSHAPSTAFLSSIARTHAHAGACMHARMHAQYSGTSTRRSSVGPSQPSRHTSSSSTTAGAPKTARSAPGMVRTH
jgi:hypothetical protein